MYVLLASEDWKMTLAVHSGPEVRPDEGREPCAPTVWTPKALLRSDDSKHIRPLARAPVKKVHQQDLKFPDAVNALT
ncbi:hypothetical protein OHB07_35450 [Streptomyces sp. NBC_00111]|uniref:hypothetical protein n=1 Tax=Streptomyces sp. NBC_00111 TaxID=2975655 RepID=UPI00324C2DFE